MGVAIIAHSNLTYFVIVPHSNKNLNVENSHIICNSIPNLKLSGIKIGSIGPTCPKYAGPMFPMHVVHMSCAGYMSLHSGHQKIFNFSEI
jgi:hypothetical protein